MLESTIIKGKLKKLDREIVLAGRAAKEQTKRITNIKKRIHKVTLMLIQKKLKEHGLDETEVSIECRPPGSYHNTFNMDIRFLVYFKSEDGCRDNQSIEFEVIFKGTKSNYKFTDIPYDSKATQFVRDIVSDFAQRVQWVGMIHRRVLRAHIAQRNKVRLDDVTDKLVRFTKSNLEFCLEDALFLEKMQVGNFYQMKWPTQSPKAIVKVTPHTILFDPLEGDEHRLYKKTVLGKLRHDRAELLTKEELVEQMLEEQLA